MLTQLNPADQNHAEWGGGEFGFGFDEFCGRAEVEYRVVFRGDGP